ncbi:hypothetical protein HHK36_020386 [Tetracentron sinense]|uniref:S-protein homolog n=1 Tax=Tetracentron sinense TaxID=13715 RepID=A0A835CXT3_TETSI|nr:hypothetical protein HHK36_031718 [Tetracentron sinense]KAF8394179.1 hypothetical protein HHK36_020386 [Tetracentron sinense]
MKRVKPFQACGHKMTSLDRFVLIFVLAIALTLNESRKVIGKRHGDAIFSKHNVYVGNDLGEGVTLNLRCASKDDDLGTHVLPYGQNYSWGFRSNFWGSTLFWCDFKWGNVTDTFTVYDDNNSEQYYHTNAHWLSRMDGLYYYHHHYGEYELYHNWGNGHKMTSLDRFVLIFVLAIALTLNESRKVIGIRHEDGIFSKHHVYVGNDLGEGLTLNLHCASKDDDLGTHVLPYGQNYNWGFRSNFWGTTLFWCDFKWGNVTDSYSVYDEDSVDQSEHTDTRWLARKDGIYYYRRPYGLYELFNNWRK